MAASSNGSPRPRFRTRIRLVIGAGLLLAGLLPTAAAPALASHTPDPSSVTIAGSLQSELGCPGDWDAACAATHLLFDADDDVWQGTFDVPAGDWEYKAPLNDAWDENYGLHATPGGANIPLSLGTGRSIKFYYDHDSHWVTDNVTSVIAVAPGSFQSELGCPGDWDPGCLLSWLQDADGDGIYTLETTSLPAGSYEGKVAINETWDENYGQGGVPGGANISFSVPANNAKVTFRYVAATHVLTILAGHGADGNVEWDGLRHDSRSDAYRTPGGAVPAGTAVTLRFRTFHDDVTGVRVRFFSLRLGGQQIVSMTRAASDVSCYQAGLETETCDFWQVTIPPAIADQPDNLWYRFLVSDGADNDYYADDTPALDGGLGAPTDEAVDQSWALMQFVPGFTAPAWAKDAVIYQIFPDRFRNGRHDNDPRTGDVRYDDPVLRLGWGVNPEGYCRNYEDGATNCPWRFDTTPPADSPTKEQPRGRDYMGGDLKGVDQKLDYLADLGVTAIYFNPVFDAGSNHSYDTQDYKRIDPAFGTQKDWDNLIKHASKEGIRVILDGVFNHMSSDSPLFDRYHHFSTVGACESTSSPYRSWFVFTEVGAGNGKCAGAGGPDSAAYEGWFGFDSIPVLAKSLPAIQAYFLTAPDSIAKRWLAAGASGWRMDVSGDPSFPNGYWESFRSVVKAAKPDALTISETWQKDSTLLRMLRGDRLDTTMNYRLRDAVLALLAPQGFDSKGFADSGHQISVSDFADRLASQREDYPDAAYYSLMNLLDSHDTERLLWTLTPGPETTAGREGTPANVADGKLRVRLASLIQFTVPGAPTVYYGDEVGMTGDDDPDDRRTYPWADTGGSPDRKLLAHYESLADLRDDVSALTDGDFRSLLANDADETVAYGRRTRLAGRRRGPEPIRLGALAHDPGRWLPAGRAVARPPLRRRCRGQGERERRRRIHPDHAAGDVGCRARHPKGRPRAAGRARSNLHVTNEAANQLSVAWNSAAGAVAYDVYVSPLSGGGYVRANEAPVVGTSFTIDGLPNAKPAYVVVRGLDAAGNASAASNEAVGVPHLAIGWANLQWPPAMTHTVSAVDRTDNAYGQIWIDGVTNQPGADARPDRPARVRAGRLEPGRERGLVVGRRLVQRRRRQQRRVRRIAAAGSAGDVRLRLPLLGHERSRLGLRRPRRDRQRLPGRSGRLADGARQRRHDAAGGPGGADRGLGFAGRDRAGMGRRRRRPDAVRLRGPARRRRRWAVRDDRLDIEPDLHRHERDRGPGVLLRRPLGRHLVQPVRTIGRGHGHGRAPDGDADVQRHGPGLDGRDRSLGVHRGLPRPAGWRPAAVGPGRRRALPCRRDALDDHADRQGVDPARVQVHARRLGARREGSLARLRRAVEPAADAQLRSDGHAGRERHGRQLEERRTLRQLSPHAGPIEARNSSGPSDAVRR